MILLRIALVCLLSSLVLLQTGAAQGTFGSRDAVEGETSMNPQDLAGIWAFEGGGQYSASSRLLEFLPDGTVFESNRHSNSGGGYTTERRKRVWVLQQNKILINEPSGSGRSGYPTIEIALPFNKTRLELSEVYTSTDTTRTSTMFATRTTPPAPSPAPGTSPSANAAPLGAAKVQLTVTPSVKNSTDSYYKVQKLSLSVTLKNSDLKVSSGPLTVNYWILGVQTQDAKQFCLLKSGTFTCSLGTQFSDREFKTTTEPIMNRFYPYSSSYSEYGGWIVVVKNSSGQVIAVKASKSEWERQFVKAVTMERGTVYDLRLNKLDGLRAYYEE
ncbi:MAG: hypothetical protein ACOYM3_03970 [Terrimicrobiaceae bacterium]